MDSEHNPLIATSGISRRNALALAGIAAASLTGCTPSSTESRTAPRGTKPIRPNGAAGTATCLPAGIKLSPQFQRDQAVLFEALTSAAVEYIPTLNEGQGSVMLATWASLESGLNPEAATSNGEYKTHGLFQLSSEFIDNGYWGRYGLTTLGDAYNPDTACDIAARRFSDAISESCQASDLNNIAAANLMPKHLTEQVLTHFNQLASMGLLTGPGLTTGPQVGQCL